MFGKKKVVAIEPPVANDRLTAEVLEKHVNTIRRNELVCNDKELASEIVQRSQLVKYPKDHVMITHGQDADEVYFLLFGSTRVLINSRQIDAKCAPETVGEMAAMKPGTARSADVIVNTEGVVARVMSAHDFSDTISRNQGFHDRLFNMIDVMGRKNINLLGEELKTTKPNWTWTALCVGVAFGALLGLGSWGLVFWCPSFVSSSFGTWRRRHRYVNRNTDESRLYLPQHVRAMWPLLDCT